MESDTLVLLDGSMPAVPAPPEGGHGWGLIVIGSGPHGVGVRCDCCDRHLGWLPREVEEEPIIDDEDIIDF